MLTKADEGGRAGQANADLCSRGVAGGRAIATTTFADKGGRGGL